MSLEVQCRSDSVLLEEIRRFGMQNDLHHDSSYSNSAVQDETERVIPISLRLPPASAMEQTVFEKLSIYALHLVPSLYELSLILLPARFSIPRCL